MKLFVTDCPDCGGRTSAFTRAAPTRCFDCEGAEVVVSTPPMILIRVVAEPGEVQAYLPANYAVAGVGVDPSGRRTTIVRGYDNHGWTAAGYVIPRLASGMISAEILLGEG